MRLVSVHPKKYITTSLISVCALAMTCTTIYFYLRYQEVQQYRSFTSQDQAELPEVIKKVERHILLPKGETPTLATVSEREKLSDQKFFENAENGDKVLVYVQAKRAFLYRPRIDKIIEVSPITVGDEAIVAGAATEVNPPAPARSTSDSQIQPATDPVKTQDPAIKSFSIEIRNRTSNQSAASRLQRELNREHPAAEFSIDSSSVESEFPRSQVILQNNEIVVEAKAIASLIGAIYAIEMPLGESRTQADLLIIIGEDYASR